MNAILKLLFRFLVLFPITVVIVGYSVSSVFNLYFGDTYKMSFTQAVGVSFLASIFRIRLEPLSKRTKESLQLEKEFFESWVFFVFDLVVLAVVAHVVFFVIKVLGGFF